VVRQASVQQDRTGLDEVTVQLNATESRPRHLNSRNITTTHKLWPSNFCSISASGLVAPGDDPCVYFCPQKPLSSGSSSSRFYFAQHSRSNSHHGHPAAPASVAGLDALVPVPPRKRGSWQTSKIHLTLMRRMKKSFGMVGLA
jgi:hypothetical protein